MKIYMAGAITGAPDWVLEQHEELAKELQIVWPEARIFVPHQHEDPHGDIYARDLNEISNSDLLVANLNAPSTGTGMELAFAWDNGIPIMAYRSPDIQLSPFVRGWLHVRKIDCISIYTEKSAAEVIRNLYGDT